jgi:ABC-2 type transport system ATP-binding protein
MIVADGLTKRYGTTTVVGGLRFGVQPGRVTGFLGPNGAGKTQTLKMILGLVRPTSGRATIGGRPLAAHAHPARVVGSVLDGGAFNPGRSGRHALSITALLAGVPPSQVGGMLERVGLGQDGDRKVGDYSLGMRQRLALAQALLPEPAVLIADEPANGLDPAGISWLRELLRELARGGTTVLLSSHLLSEAERLIDDVIVISRGRIVAHGPLEQVRGEGPAEHGLEERFLELTATPGGN